MKPKNRTGENKDLPTGLFWRGEYLHVKFMRNGISIQRSSKTKDPGEALKFLKRLKKEHMQESKKGKKIESKGDLSDINNLIEFTYDRYWVDQTDGKHSKIRVEKAMKMLKCGVKDITPVKIDTFIIKLKKKKFTPSTINSYLSNLHVLMKVAKEHDVISEAFEFPRLKTRSRIRVWTPEEIISAIVYFTEVNSRITEKSKEIDDAIADLIVVLLDTGMRLGEAVKIRYVKNIDFHNNCINLFEDITKTAKPRSIEMTKRVQKILENRRYYFPIHPFPYDRPLLSRRIRKMSEYYDFEKGSLRLHDLRHTFATRMVRKGISLYVVSRMLGHSNIRTTEMYAHLLPLDIKSGFSILEEDEYSGLGQRN